MMSAAAPPAQRHHRLPPPARSVLFSDILFAHLAAWVDAVHALSMVAWVLGMPLLFWHRWPRLTRAYAIYAVSFAIVSEGTQAWLGECFLTSISRWFWLHQDGATRTLPNEWFTVRLAHAVFGFIPSHHVIADISKALIVLMGVGVLFTMARARARARV